MGCLIREYLRNYHSYETDVRRVIIKADLDAAVSSLHRRGELDDTDVKIIALLTEGFTNNEMVDVLPFTRAPIDSKVKRICNTIEGELGSEYEDSRILGQVRSRLGRDLTEDEAKFCWFIINNGERWINRELSIFNFEVDAHGRIKTKNT